MSKNVDFGCWRTCLGSAGDQLLGTFFSDYSFKCVPNECNYSFKYVPNEWYKCVPNEC